DSAKIGIELKASIREGEQLLLVHGQNDDAPVGQDAGAAWRVVEASVLLSLVGQRRAEQSTRHAIDEPQPPVVPARSLEILSAVKHRDQAGLRHVRRILLRNSFSALVPHPPDTRRASAAISCPKSDLPPPYVKSARCRRRS